VDKDGLEQYISSAEVAWKGGNTALAIHFARKALSHCRHEGKIIALKIFIARAHSKLKNYKASNAIYRALINEKIYLPPIILGLFYNNFKTASAEKQQLNLNLIKLYLG
jgi:hypothetical protein